MQTSEHKKLDSEKLMEKFCLKNCQLNAVIFNEANLF